MDLDYLEQRRIDLIDFLYDGGEWFLTEGILYVMGFMFASLMVYQFFHHLKKSKRSKRKKLKQGRRASLKKRFKKRVIRIAKKYS